ncbi:hypothetical protein V2550_08280 [Tenacibaculum maritimum]
MKRFVFFIKLAFCFFISCKAIKRNERQEVGIEKKIKVEDFITFGCRINDDSIYFILKNNTSKVLRISNPKYWSFIQSNLYSQNEVLVPSIKVKPYIGLRDNMLIIEPYQKIETKFDYTISQLYKVKLKGNYTLNFIYRGKIKIKSINSNFETLSNSVLLEF